jgi:hypothetical protein
MPYLSSAKASRSLCPFPGKLWLGGCFYFGWYIGCVRSSGSSAHNLSKAEDFDLIRIADSSILANMATADEFRKAVRAIPVQPEDGETEEAFYARMGIGPPCELTTTSFDALFDSDARVKTLTTKSGKKVVVKAIPICAHCDAGYGKNGRSLPPPKLKCARCHNAMYCDAVCQKADYKNHKAACRLGAKHASFE